MHIKFRVIESKLYIFVRKGFKLIFIWLNATIKEIIRLKQEVEEST